MTKTTQETIKFARNWLENGIEDEPSPVVVHELAKAVVELADEIEALNYANASLGVKINGKKAKIKNLVSELAALKEKYRWRKRSKEPAPNDDTLIICLLKKGGRCSWQAVIQARFIKQFEEPENNIFFWRPLDLPEESK